MQISWQKSRHHKRCIENCSKEMVCCFAMHCIFQWAALFSDIKSMLFQNWHSNPILSFSHKSRPKIQIEQNKPRSLNKNWLIKKNLNWVISLLLCDQSTTNWQFISFNFNIFRSLHFFSFEFQWEFGWFLSSFGEEEWHAIWVINFLDHRNC